MKFDEEEEAAEEEEEESIEAIIAEEFPVKYCIQQTLDAQSGFAGMTAACLLFIVLFLKFVLSFISFHARCCADRGGSRILKWRDTGAEGMASGEGVSPSSIGRGLECGQCPLPRI